MARSSVVPAFSEGEVSRLTGIAVAQLRYWDRTNFFAPSFADSDRRFAYSRVYSFRDLVSLRVINGLRNRFGVSLQQLRLVSDALGHLSDEKWTKTTLYVLGKKVVFDEAESRQKREVVSGQYALGIPLAVESANLTQDVKEFRRRSHERVGVITQNRLVSHNAPVLAGTRIPVAAIQRFSEAGYSVRAILKEYPDLTEIDVRAAIAHRDRIAA